MYNFQKFEGRNTKTDDRISIGKHHSIGLPTQFVKKNNIRSMKYVVLYFDKERLAIGLLFTNDPGSDRFSIIHSRQGYGAIIVARSFFKVNEIDPTKYKRKYVWKKHFQEGVGDLFVIELEKLFAGSVDNVVSHDVGEEKEVR